MTYNKWSAVLLSASLLLPFISTSEFIVLLCHGYSTILTIKLVSFIHVKKYMLCNPYICYNLSISKLSLVPLSTFSPLPSFLESSEEHRSCITSKGTLVSDCIFTSSMTPGSYVLCVAEEDDLPYISQLTVEAFNLDFITLSHYISPYDSSRPQLDKVLGNTYFSSVDCIEVFKGLQSRTKGRFKKNGDILRSPSLSIKSDLKMVKVASEMSLLLALGRSTKNVTVDVIAVIELRLQPTEKKISFGMQWISNKFWRVPISFLSKRSKYRKNVTSMLQPYITNLCVKESFRCRKIGRALIRCIECLARDTWGYEKLYLHVDLHNSVALKLYQSEGYQLLSNSCWNQVRLGNYRHNIGYFEKVLT